MNECEKTGNCWYVLAKEELDKAITVNELIEQLKGFDGNLKVLAHDDWSEFAVTKDSVFLEKCNECDGEYVEINVEVVRK